MLIRANAQILTIGFAPLERVTPYLSRTRKYSFGDVVGASQLTIPMRVHLEITNISPKAQDRQGRGGSLARVNPSHYKKGAEKKKHTPPCRSLVARQSQGAQRAIDVVARPHPEWSHSTVGIAVVGLTNNVPVRLSSSSEERAIPR